MEEILASSTAESLQNEAAEGQRHLEETVEAAHEILASLDEVLGNAALWSQPTPSTAPDAGGGAAAAAKPGVSLQEQGWLAPETGRLRYKAAMSALRNSITTIFNHPRMRLQDDESAKEKAPSVELEMRAAQLREEAFLKNQMLKQVIDQSRELVSDISLWQSAEL